MDQLRPLAEELIARKVAVIAALGGTNTAMVVKEITSTIPIVFTTGADPVMSGLVASLSRPDANVTGVSWFSTELRQQAHRGPQRARPAGRADCDTGQPEQSGSGSLPAVCAGRRARFGRRLLVLKAGTVRDIDAVFATLAEQRAGAVIVAADPFYPGRARQLAVLAARHALPMSRRCARSRRPAACSATATA